MFGSVERGNRAKSLGEMAEKRQERPESFSALEINFHGHRVHPAVKLLYRLSRNAFGSLNFQTVEFLHFIRRNPWEYMT